MEIGKQSIYKFAGSDTNSLNALRKTFNTKELPLNICYRCPEKVIRLARTIVPDIEWNEKREDKGKVEVIEKRDLYKFIDKDSMILARLNSDLLDVYKQFVFDKNIPVKFKNLDLVNKIKKDIYDCIDFYIRNYNKDLNIEVELKEALKENPNLNRDEKVKELMKQKSEDENRVKCKRNYNIDYLKRCLNDYQFYGSFTFKEDIFHQYLQIINALIDIFKKENSSIYVKDFKMFVNDFLKGNLNNDVAILSSIHMAKGSEADKVFIVDYPEFPYEFKDQSDEDKQQERNLQYVAITRAKKELYLCLIDNKDNSQDVEEKNTKCKKKVDFIMNRLLY